MLCRLSVYHSRSIDSVWRRIFDTASILGTLPPSLFSSLHKFTLESCSLIHPPSHSSVQDYDNLTPGITISGGVPFVPLTVVIDYLCSPCPSQPQSVNRGLVSECHGGGYGDGRDSTVPLFYHPRKMSAALPSEEGIFMPGRKNVMWHRQAKQETVVMQ